MTPLRVGLYTLRFPKITETWAVNKFVGLAAAGVDVHMYTRTGGGGDWSRFPALADPALAARVHEPSRGAVAVVRRAVRHPVSFARFVAHNWRWRHRSGLGFRAGVAERLAFVGARLDVLHLELDTLAPGVADLKHYLGCKLVLSGRSSLQYTGRPDRWPGGYASLFDLADAYHVETAYTRDNLRALGLPGRVPITLIRSNIDAYERYVPSERPLREPDRPLHVLSAGRVEPEKGLEFALEAVAALVQQGVAVRYRIVGDGQHRPAVELAVHQLGLHDHVELAGRRPPDEMMAHYQWADVLLHLSTDEGVPNVPLEAQAMGVPAIVSSAAGNPDTVDAHVSGFVVDVYDSAAAAAHLAELAAEPRRAAAMGRAARARMLAQPTPTEWIARYVALYEQVCGAGPA